MGVNRARTDGSLKGFVVAEVEETAVFASSEEAGARVARVATIQQVFLVELQLHNLVLFLQAVEFGCVAAHCHHDLAIVVAELRAVDEAIGGLRACWGTYSYSSQWKVFSSLFYLQSHSCSWSFPRFAPVSSKLSRISKESPAILGP